MAKFKQSGFVILYAVILVSIVLTISLSIFNIVYRQLVLSSTVRDSQFSLFAADSIFDCVKYWDVAYQGYELPTAANRLFGFFDDNNVFVAGVGIDIKCGLLTDSSIDRSGPSYEISNFEFNISESEPAGAQKSCVKGEVKKSLTTQKTDIRVWGYNTDCPNISSYNRAVERILMSRY